MPVDQVGVLSAVILVMIVALVAVGLSIAAAFLPTKRRGLLTVALCLWCVLAGFTLSSAVWAWMTDENLRYVQTQLSEMPPDAKAREVTPYTMSMLVFFLQLDHLGRKFLYSTVIVPLAICIFARAKTNRTASKEKPPGSQDADPYFQD